MITNIPIERGIPIPGDPRPGAGMKQLVGLMEVGDSIFLAGRKLNAVRSYCYRLGELHEFKLIARAVDGGVRVWRTA